MAEKGSVPPHAATPPVPQFQQPLLPRSTPARTEGGAGGSMGSAVTGGGVAAGGAPPAGSAVAGEIGALASGPAQHQQFHQARGGGRAGQDGFGNRRYDCFDDQGFGDFQEGYYDGNYGYRNGYNNQNRGNYRPRPYNNQRQWYRNNNNYYRGAGRNSNNYQRRYNNFPHPQPEKESHDVEPISEVVAHVSQSTDTVVAAEGSGNASSSRAQKKLDKVLCLKCGQLGHFADACKAVLCIYCEKISHESKDCPLLSMANPVAITYGVCRNDLMFHETPASSEVTFKHDSGKVGKISVIGGFLSAQQIIAELQWDLQPSDNGTFKVVFPSKADLARMTKIIKVPVPKTDMYLLFEEWSASDLDRVSRPECIPTTTVDHMYEGEGYGLIFTCETELGKVKSDVTMQEASEEDDKRNDDSNGNLPKSSDSSSGNLPQSTPAPMSKPTVSDAWSDSKLLSLRPRKLWGDCCSDEDEGLPSPLPRMVGFSRVHLEVHDGSDLVNLGIDKGSSPTDGVVSQFHVPTENLKSFSATTVDASLSPLHNVVPTEKLQLFSVLSEVDIITAVGEQSLFVENKANVPLDIASGFGSSKDTGFDCNKVICFQPHDVQSHVIAEGILSHYEKEQVSPSPLLSGSVGIHGFACTHMSPHVFCDPDGSLNSPAGKTKVVNAVTTAVISNGFAYDYDGSLSAKMPEDECGGSVILHGDASEVFLGSTLPNSVEAADVSQPDVLAFAPTCSKGKSTLKKQESSVVKCFTPADVSVSEVLSSLVCDSGCIGRDAAMIYSDVTSDMQSQEPGKSLASELGVFCSAVQKQDASSFSGIVLHATSEVHKDMSSSSSEFLRDRINAVSDGCCTPDRITSAGTAKGKCLTAGRVFSSDDHKFIQPQEADHSSIDEADHVSFGSGFEDAAHVVSEPLSDRVSDQIYSKSINVSPPSPLGIISSDLLEQVSPNAANTNSYCFNANAVEKNFVDAEGIQSNSFVPTLGVCTSGGATRGGTGVFLGGRCSVEDVVNFGGVSPPSIHARSSQRIRHQGNADATEMERAQNIAKAKEAAFSAGTSNFSRFSLSSISDDTFLARATTMGVSLGATQAQVNESIANIKDVDNKRTLITIQKNLENKEIPESSSSSALLDKVSSLSSDLDDDTQLIPEEKSPIRVVKKLRVYKRREKVVPKVVRRRSRLSNKNKQSN
ncbi:hypothetical protein ACQ4PT_017693 [Festuca glaucescens]